MQHEYNMLKDERDKMRRAADRYCEELHHQKEELKRAAELLASHQQSLLTAENEREHVGRELEKARAHLEEARTIIQEKDRALQTAVWERDTLRAGMAAEVGQAKVDVV